MAITEGNAASTGPANLTSPHTLSLTLVSADDYILVRHSNNSDNEPLTSVVIDSSGANQASFTQEIQQQGFGNPGVGGMTCGIWYLTGTNVPPAGTYDIEFTWGADPTGTKLHAQALQGAADQAPEVSDDALLDGSTSVSLSLTTLTDGARIYDHIHVSATISGMSADAGQTEDYNDAAASADHVAGSHEDVATAGSESVGWSWTTSGDAIQVAAAIAPSSGGGGSTGSALNIAPIANYHLNQLRK